MENAQSRLGGIALMITAFVLFAGVDSCAKYLGATLPVGQVVFLRYLFALFYGIIFISAIGGFKFFRTQKPGLQIARGLLLGISTLANFIALQYLRLDQTSVIMFSAPLWVCALSVPLLGEKVGLRRWSAVIVGFLGILVIIRPGSEAFHWAMLVSLSSTLSVSLYLIISRKVAPYDSAETSMFYPTLVGALASGPAASLDWIQPLPFDWMVIIIMGLCGGIGHHFLSQAHRMAPAPILAPFIYTQIVSMSIMGYFFFGDIPDRWTFTGATIVIASGLYLWFRERQTAAVLPQTRGDI